ncbi:unnamed protein product [Schistosoma intercalatum]|nr:unnamed protein product [Schistosoma intercalatum]
MSFTTATIHKSWLQRVLKARHGKRELSRSKEVKFLAQPRATALEAQNRIRACCFRSRYFPGGHDVLVNKE